MNSIHIKIVILGLMLGCIAAFFIFGIDNFFTVETVKILKSEITDYKNSHPLQTAIIFFLIYVAGTSLSLPVAGILSITGGALFGLIWGTLLVTIAGTTGATIAFLLSRYLFREYVQYRYGDRLSAINEGVKNNGNVYLLTMRLIPVIPYFIINAAMGVTPMPVYAFSLITFLGMVPVTTILVNGGAQIATINTVQDIMSIKVVFSFILIGLIPIIAHRVSVYLNTR